MFFNFLLYTVILNTFYMFFIKSNNFENNFWFLVEILNNNNKSLFLFFILFLFFFNLYLYNNQHLHLFFILINMFLFLSVLMYLSNFFFNICVVVRNYNLNTTLINGVVLIHPILVYITYILLIILTNIVYNNTKYMNYFFYLLKNSLNRLLFCSFIALFLGGWWAQQELNWGGWWNWDFVEIIALIFYILILYLTHTRIYVNYNNFNFLVKIIFFYLFCFFLFVRVDILNSIHSFNSFSVTNNLNNYILFLTVVVIFNIFIKLFFFFNKFGLCAKHNLHILSVFFKLINFIFLCYFFLNVFLVIYLNYQFTDITKYVKFMLILLMYNYILIEFYKNKHYLLIFIIIASVCSYNFINWINSLLITIMIYFFKLFSIKRLSSFTSHILFLYFVIYIKYNFIQIYSNIDLFQNSFNYFLLNSNFVLLANTVNNSYNYISIFVYDLLNFHFINNFNDFFFINNLQINNIVYNENSFIYYNIDDYNISLLLYKINIIFYTIFVFALCVL